MRNDISREWYSISKVKEIFTPNLTSWRSRYDLKDQLLLADETLVIRNMRASDLVSPRNSDDTEHEVEAREAYRPDIIANNAYGDPRFAWIILSANNLSDIFDLHAGKRIIIPSITSIYMTGGIMTR